MIETWQQEKAAERKPATHFSIAKAGQAASGGGTVTLIFPGQSSATRKRYKVEAQVPALSAGDKVSITRIGSTYVVTGKL